MKKAIICSLFIALVSVTSIYAQSAQSRRVALVVGNGAYAANTLRNPPNDATDVAAALKDAGFEVTLLKDADLTAFDKAVASFAASLNGADTGLFYYAGHGVAVDGMNYLIPVSPRIDDAAAVKAKAVAVDTVVGRMEASGVRTVLIFLDSCRDNPFPGMSRSDTRGLVVVDTPKSVNSMIAYATSPGDTAADGTGRNGVFSGAFLAQLKLPGQELAELMRNVSADVTGSTGGKQQPRVDYGMKEAFYFVSPEMLAVRAQGALNASRAEVAQLEKELADRQAKISATRDAQTRQALEVEQQRQQAIAVAKRIETENLAREAEKQKRLADEANATAAQKAARVLEQAKQQSELADLATTRRAELEKLAVAGSSDNPDILIETVERLEVVLREVDGQYAAALAASLSSSNGGYDKQLASISGQTPDITESDAEFGARIIKEKAKLETERQAELARLRDSAETQRVAQTQAMRKQFDDTLATLQHKVWTLTGSGATLSPGTFDRNTKLWPFMVASADLLVPMLPIQLVADLNTAPDPKATILALDSAVKAGALIAEIDWGITRDAANKRYAVDVRAVRVINLTSGALVASAQPSQRVSYFTAGKRHQPVSNYGKLQLDVRIGDKLQTVVLSGDSLGGPLQLGIPASMTLVSGDYSLAARWPSGKERLISLQIEPGSTRRIKLVEPYTEEQLIFMRLNGVFGTEALNITPASEVPFLFGFSMIRELSGASSILNPTFIQFDLNPGILASTLAAVPIFDTSIMFGTWLFGKASTRPRYILYALGLNRDKFFGVHAGISSGLGVSSRIGTFVKVDATVALGASHWSTEIHLQALIPLDSFSSVEYRIEIPLLGFGFKTKTMER